MISYCCYFRHRTWLRSG